MMGRSKDLIEPSRKDTGTDMPTYEQRDVQAFCRKMLESNVQPFPASDETDDALARQFIAAMADGRLADCLPYPFYDSVFAWIRRQVSDGNTEVVVSIVTSDRGQMSFMYDVISSDVGLDPGAAIELHVPERPGSIDVAPNMLGRPAIVVDVSGVLLGPSHEHVTQ